MLVLRERLLRDLFALSYSWALEECGALGMHTSQQQVGLTPISIHMWYTHTLTLDHPHALQNLLGTCVQRPLVLLEAQSIQWQDTIAYLHLQQNLTLALRAGLVT